MSMSTKSFFGILQFWKKQNIFQKNIQRPLKQAFSFFAFMAQQFKQEETKLVLYLAMYVCITIRMS